MAEIRARISESQESRTSESEEQPRRLRAELPRRQTIEVDKPKGIIPRDNRDNAPRSIPIQPRDRTSTSSEQSREQSREHPREQSRIHRSRTIEIVPVNRPPKDIIPKDNASKDIISKPRDLALLSADKRLKAENEVSATESASESGETTRERHKRPHNTHIKQMRTEPRDPPLPPSSANNSIAVAKYTDEAITQLLAGYIQVSPTLYDYVPIGAHIRYFRKDRATNSRNATFKLGGFVQNHYRDSMGKPMLMLETVPGSCVSCGHEPAYRLNNHVLYPLAYDEIDELWKKYDAGAFIEIHLIQGSLARKDKKIAELEDRIRALEMRSK